MKTLAAVTAAWLMIGFVPQQDPAALVEQLRADDIDVRERAYGELEKLGAGAEAALMKAAVDPDSQLALLAGRLLRTVALERDLSPAMKKHFPGLARRLGRSAGGEWTRLYLEVRRAEPDASGTNPYHGLTRADLEPLAAVAIRTATTLDDKVGACRAAGEWFHRSAQPALVALLRDPEYKVRDAARDALYRLRGIGIIRFYMSELADDPRLLVEALDSRSSSLPLEAKARLIPLVRHADSGIRGTAIELLTRLGMPDPVVEALPLLKEKDEGMKRDGLRLLRGLGNRDHVAAILPLLSDAAASIRTAAIETVSSLKGAIPSETLMKLMEDPDSDVRYAAISVRSGKIGPEFLPILRRNLVHENDSVRRQAFRALNEAKDPELPDRAIEMLHAAPPNERVWAMNQLAWTGGGEKTIAAIRAILESRSEETYTRRTALDLLARLKSEPPPEKLREFTLDADKSFAIAAANRLLDAAPELARGEFARLVADDEIRPGLKLREFIERARPDDPVPPLMTAFESSDRGREDVGEALVRLKAESLASAMKAHLKSEDRRLCMAAIRVLGRLKAVEARPELLELLGDADEEIRWMALDALGSMGFGDTWEPIRLQTLDKNEELRTTAVRALWRHPTKEMIPTFKLLLEDPHKDIVEMAAVTLLELGHREVVDTLVDRLGSSSYVKYTVASEILSVLDPSEAHAKILALLDHRDTAPRLMGVWMMQTAGLKREARRLLPYLRECWLGGEAASAIVTLDARELIPDLEALLKDPEAEVRENALIALAGLGGIEFAPKIRDLLADPEVTIRLRAVETLGLLGDRASVQRLVEFLKSPQPMVRDAAVKALGLIGDASAGASLLPLLVGSQDRINGEVAWALGRLRVNEAVPELLRMLRPFDNHTVIMDSLGELGSKEAVPELLRYLEEDKCTTCLPKALAKIQAAEAVPLLRLKLEASKSRGQWNGTMAMRLAQLGDSSYLAGLLENAAADIRYDAAVNLCELGDRRGVPELLKQAETRSWPHAALNAVRNPAAWKRMGSVRSIGVTSGVRRLMIERFGLVSGLPIRWEGLDTFDRKAWSNEAVEYRSSRDNETGRDRWERLLDTMRDGVCSRARRSDTRWSYILDSGSIRVLPAADALKFWNQWWTEEQAKKE